LIAVVPQLVMAAPDVKLIAPQLTVLVSAGLVPAQAPEPVAVRVAVNEPLLVLGVKVANAGFAFCVHEPSPPPPDQVTAE